MRRETSRRPPKHERPQASVAAMRVWRVFEYRRPVRVAGRFTT